MAKNKALAALIHSKFDSESELARALGWKRQRLNRITTGRKEPELSEACEIAKMLQVPIDILTQIFLSNKSLF